MRKTTAVLVSIALAASLAVGCGGDDDEDNTNGGAAVTEQETGPGDEPQVGSAPPLDVVAPANGDLRFEPES